MTVSGGTSPKSQFSSPQRRSLIRWTSDIVRDNEKFVLSERDSDREQVQSSRIHEDHLMRVNQF